MSKPLRCAKCGSQAYVYQTTVITFVGNEPVFAVGCSREGCSQYAMCKGVRDTKKKAIHWWNKIQKKLSKAHGYDDFV